MPAPEARAVVDCLKTVRDPETDTDVVTLGWASAPVIRDGNVFVALEVPVARASALEPVRVAAEAAVRAVPGVLSATVALTAHHHEPGAAAPPAGPPARPSAARRGAPGQGAAPAKPTAPPAAPGAAGPRSARRIAPDGVANIIAVASGKGGVGKSTTAANLALGLRAAGATVGLLDADIYGPSVPRLMGLSGKPETHDGKTLEPMQSHGLRVMSIGFLVDEETPMIWRGPMVQSALTQMLADVNWGQLDVLVVDMPPGTGDAQLTMAQQVPLAGAVIVSTPQDIALIDARKGLNMFRRVDVPVLGLIENMSTFVCPHCGTRSDIFGHGGARRDAARLGCEFLGEIPLHLTIRETSDAGHPIVAAEPDGEQAAPYLAIAQRLWDKLRSDETGRRPPPRIVMR